MSNLYVTQTVNGDLQPVKVNGESSALEIAQDEVKVKSLEIDGTGICREPTVSNQIATKRYVDDNAGADTIDMGDGFTVVATTAGTGTTITENDSLTLTAGTGITTTGTSDGVVTIACTITDTNTTYTAGDFITLTGTDFDVDVKDEDNMASNSATYLATQQSIKAYVDTTQYSTLICGMNYNLSGGNFAVIQLSGATRAFTSFANIGENTTMIAPFDGSLERIMFRSEEVAGVTVIGFHKQTDGTEVPSDTPTVSVSIDMSGVADDTSTQFAFTSSNTFSKGDVLGFSIDPANDINDAMFTIVLKYDITT